MLLNCAGTRSPRIVGTSDSGASGEILTQLNIAEETQRRLGILGKSVTGNPDTFTMLVSVDTMHHRSPHTAVCAGRGYVGVTIVRR